MSKYRRKAKVDSNQVQIVEYLRKLGFSVQPGHDDILVGRAGKTYWFELKSPSCRSKRTGEILDSKKKESQIKLEQEWKGHYKLVTSLDEILVEIEIREDAPISKVPF